jgi:ribosomal protein S14
MSQPPCAQPAKAGSVYRDFQLCRAKYEKRAKLD